MVSGTFPKKFSKYKGPITPVKRRRTRGTLYEDEFKHGDVHIDDDAGDNLPAKADIAIRNQKLYYKFLDKVPVMVDKRGAHAYRLSDIEDAQEQAFFVLSMLDADGRVGRWRKK
jgi:hypothetical protein